MLDVWLGRFSFFILNIHFQDSAWKTALQSAALEYMPRAEVRTYSDVYARLAEVSDESVVELHAVIRAKSFMLQMTGAFTINSEQSIQTYALVSDVTTSLYLMGIGERNISLPPWVARNRDPDCCRSPRQLLAEARRVPLKLYALARWHRRLPAQFETFK
jgi:hypothetical protein